MRRGVLCLLGLFAAPVWAGEPVQKQTAMDWLQRVAEAPRRLGYDGMFVFQQGDAMQAVHVVNRPEGGGKASLLEVMDGAPREVRCNQTESISASTQDGQTKWERRLNSRHFPDLLPGSVEGLLAWYDLRLGKPSRVAGLDCRQLELVPKDRYRWGYVLCADNNTNLPLKAAMVNDRGQVLMQYAFTDVRYGKVRDAASSRLAMRDLSAAPYLTAGDTLQVKKLPPGFVRVVSVKRRLPQHADETEHWVFSDGLTHISLFIEPTAKPMQPVKGESKRGMVNMLMRQVGGHQVTVLGEAPWPAIEAIAMALEAK